MRRSMALRFTAYFLALSLCTRLLDNGIRAFGKYGEYFAANGGADIGMALWPSSLLGLLADMFGSGGILLRSMIPDVSDVYSIVSLLLTLGLIAAAAALFAGGLSRDCRRLCERLDGLPGGLPGDRPSAGGAFRELDECVSRLIARFAAEARDTRGAGDECRAACEDARAQLSAARGRIETLAESGIFNKNSAETAIVMKVLKNLDDASRALERAGGEG